MPREERRDLLLQRDLLVLLLLLLRQLHLRHRLRLLHRLWLLLPWLLMLLLRLLRRLLVARLSRMLLPLRLRLLLLALRRGRLLVLQRVALHRITTGHLCRAAKSGQAERDQNGLPLSQKLKDSTCREKITWRRSCSISERALVRSARSAFSVLRSPNSSPSRVLPYTCSMGMHD